MRNLRVAWIGLAVCGIICLTTGLVLASWNEKAAREARSFQEILRSAQTAVKLGEYETLLTHIEEWIDMAKTTKNSEIKWKTHYNSGRANIEILERTDEESAYLAGRRNLRDALRENPDAFDAKHNYTYLDNLARKKGIDPEELPLASSDLPKGDETGIEGNGDKIGAENSNLAGEDKNDEENEKRDLRDKVTTGNALGVGGEPPLDIRDAIGAQDIPQTAKSGY